MEIINFVLLVLNMICAAVFVGAGNYGLAAFNFMVFLLLLSTLIK